MYNKKSYQMADYFRSKGSYYGYPECCIEAFIETFGKIKSKERYMASRKVGFVPCDPCAAKILTGTVRIEDLVSEVNSRRSCEKPFNSPKEVPLKELEVYAEEAIERRKQKERFKLVLASIPTLV